MRFILQFNAVQKSRKVLLQSDRKALNIDVANAAYYPQISGGLGTADLTKGERGRQFVSLNATQMLYDFGKTKSSSRY